MITTPYQAAQRWIGKKEVPGAGANPLIMAALRLDHEWPQDDSVPWCAAWLNFICWQLGLPRSANLRARSWLRIGQSISILQATPGFDIVIFRRAGADQPGPEVIDAPGHVGFFACLDGNDVLVLGGNQGDSVSVARYPTSRLLGVRRLE